MRRFRGTGGCWILFSACLFSSPSVLHAQDPVGPDVSDRPVRLFLDCQGSGCRDMDYYRTEIQFVNWVLDHRDSDVHLLITSQSTGAGGRSFELVFMGRERFEGRSETLTYISGFDATPDETRIGLTRIIKMGLMPFVGLTSLAGRITIGMSKPEAAIAGGRPGRGGAVAQPEDDPWDFWVFGVSTSGYWFGESTYSSGSLSSSLSAKRITEDWKITLSVRGSFSRTEIELGDRTEVNQQESYYANGLLVKSLGPHWSAGVRGSTSRVTRVNQQLAARIAPVLEYNFFPYEESTRRELTVQYSVGAVHFDYEEETIFDRTKETRFDQGIDVSLSLQQPWGTARTYVSGAHYIHDADLHNLSVGGDLSLRLFRGFRLNLGASYTRVRDQLYIIKGDLTDEDILLRRRALLTDYFTTLSFGFSYSFGSIFNNVVNPRIGGGGGGGMVIMY